jgi:hypothetical protein
VKSRIVSLTIQNSCALLDSLPELWIKKKHFIGGFTKLRSVLIQGGFNSLPKEELLDQRRKRQTQT